MDTEQSLPRLYRERPNYCAESPAAPSQPVWNAARCNRLLRPLSSKITLFRKSRQCNLILKNDRAVRVQLPVQVPVVETRPTDRPSGPYRDIFKGQDAVHLPSAVLGSCEMAFASSPVPRKRIKRTYSKVGGSGGQLAKQAAEATAVRTTSLPNEARIEMPISQNYVSHRNQVEDRPSDTCPQLHVRSASSCDLELRAPCSKIPRIPSAPSRDTFRQLARNYSPDHWKLIDGLYNGLDTLLKATSNRKAADRSGPRALLSMCLRRIPEYIAEEKIWCKAGDPSDDIDISSIVYSYLEAFGTSHTGGWRPLREVVKAHGMAMLGDAINEGLIDPTIARGLVILCMHHYAYDEAQCLINCMILIMKPLQKSELVQGQLFTHEISIELSTLYHFASTCRRFGFLYRHLAILFSNGVLPIDWMSNQGMVKCWNGVINSITQEDDYAKEATNLLQTTTLMACGARHFSASSQIEKIRLRNRGFRNACVIGSPISSHVSMSIGAAQLATRPIVSQTSVPSTATSGTVSSLMTVLCANGLVQRPALANALNHFVLQKLAVQAHQNLEIAAYKLRKSEDAKPHRDEIYLLLLAVQLLEQAATASLTKFGLNRSICFNAITRTGGSSTFLSKAGSFLCGIARCCQRATAVDSFYYLQSMVQQLVHLSSSDDYRLTARRLCGGVALAAAFEYLEETNLPRHLDWALDLEKDANSTWNVKIDRTPGERLAREPTQRKGGYKWEEGICEWVAQTPVVALRNMEWRKHQDYSMPGQNQDSSPLPPSTSPAWGEGLRLSQDSTCCDDSSDGGITSSATVQGATQPICCKLKRKSSSSDHIRAQNRNCSSYDQPLLAPLIKTPQMTWADDMADELSRPESSQEMLEVLRPKLREVTNIVSNTKRKKGRTSRYSGAAIIKDRNLYLRAAQVKWRGESAESEDELSVLA